MPWWGWVSVAIPAWLLMARWSMRWCRELQPDNDLDLHVLVSLLIPWIAILNLFPVWLTKRGCRPDERTLRMVVGESRWHRAERLAREHEQRCKELGMPT
jgi:hypothetical protein